MAEDGAKRWKKSVLGAVPKNTTPTVNTKVEPKIQEVFSPKLNFATGSGGFMNRDSIRNSAVFLAVWNDKLDYIAIFLEILAFFFMPPFALMLEGFVSAFNLITFVAIGMGYGFGTVIHALPDLIPIVGLGKFCSTAVKEARIRQGIDQPDDEYKNKYGSYLNRGYTATAGKFVLPILLALFVMSAILPYYGINLMPPGIGRVIAESYRAGVTWFAQIWDTITEHNPWDVATGWWKDQIRIASGGYFEGQVDKKKAASVPDLGVKVDTFKAQTSRIREGEPVILWAHLQAKALDFYENRKEQPIEVTSWCAVDKNNDDYNKIPNGETNYIHYYGDQYVSCEFSELDPGPRVIKLYAKYPFETKAYLKTYFMDESRIRTLRMMEKDPLQEFNIVDHNPIAVYTDGPVKLGIGSPNAIMPYSVPDETSKLDSFVTSLGITLANRMFSAGTILEVTNIQFQLPAGLALDNEKCDFEANKTGSERDTVLNEGYDIYKVNMRSKKLLPRLRNITRDLTLNCKLKIKDREKLLKNAGFATKYIRVTVNYIYRLTKRHTVYVQKIAAEETT